MQDKRVPLDTLGHPLPPPVRAEHVCKIHREDWGKWWTNYFNDTLERELDCCVCGLHFTLRCLIPLDRALLDPDVQRRVLNTTAPGVRVCRGCRAACWMCDRLIVNAQKQKHGGMCMECLGRRSAKKRKAPSGS
jgi:hypothetical protein